MKTAKQPASEGPGGPSRRAQPVRQTRTNPPRTSSLNRGNSFTSAPAQEQPIDIFPAVTHFVDAIAALPKELVRHFTLLKEVDAKIFAPEEELFKLLDAALKTPIPDVARSANDATTPRSAAISVHGSNSGGGANVLPAAAISDVSANAAAFDPRNLERRTLFRQTAFKIQEMLVSLEEKNHVISTANDALQKQLGRIEDTWPELEKCFSDEAKWGSTTHWAYVENRPSKTNNAQAERSRREGAATLSAAAQQLAEEAAARSSDRKQALAAKKNQKAQASEQDAEGKHQDSKKTQGGAKSRKPVGDVAAPVGLGITGTAPSSTNARSKGRAKVNSDRKPDEPSNTAPTDRAMAAVFGFNAPKPKTTSPRETPAPEAPGKKRKALPTSSGQAKKSRTTAGMSPSVASSPLLGVFPDSLKIGRSSPVPLPNQPRPASSRARQNSAQSNNTDTVRRPTSAASNKPNGSLPGVVDPGIQSNGSKASSETKIHKETAVLPPIKPEPFRPETVTAVPLPPEPPAPNGANGKKDGVTKAVEERENKRDSVTPVVPPTPLTAVKTKSGRASKPSTPAIATFAEAAAASSHSNSRSRSSRNAESGSSTGTGAGNGGTSAATAAAKRSHKKGASISAAAAAALTGTVQALGAQIGSGSVGDDSKRKRTDDEVDDEPDKDEPRYCFCNQVSYGAMVGCDADDCPREWFHLECVGLEVAPGRKTKWYCEDCKKRLRIGERVGR